MRVTSYTVQAMSVDNNHIFFDLESPLGGTFIVFLEFPNKRIGQELWKEFLEKHPDPIYFGTDDPSYIGNHCKFFGNFGGKKVYQYVR